MIYTTNAIETLNRQPRKAIKTKGSFPSEQSAIKLIYLAICNAVPQWTRTHGWTKAVLAFKIQFGTASPTNHLPRLHRSPDALGGYYPVAGGGSAPCPQYYLQLSVFAVGFDVGGLVGVFVVLGGDGGLGGLGFGADVGVGDGEDAVFAAVDLEVEPRDGGVGDGVEGVDEVVVAD
ncbi:MAG TPA: transposase, partial [Thermoleophilaceae bacterium]